MFHYINCVAEKLFVTIVGRQLGQEMPSHPDRVRKNYPKEPIYYFPCERYNDHVLDAEDKCIFCKRTKIEIDNVKREDR
jgi:hypothetical protein